MKTVLITGGANGIGLAVASSFLNESENYYVLIGDVDIKCIEKAKDSLKKYSDRVSFYYLDVSQKDSVIKTFKEIEKIHKGIDVLVNNAGISPKHNGKALELEELSLEEWQNVMDVNLTGAFLCTQSAVPHMKRNQWGRIINIASQSSRTAAQVAGIHYSTSKTGLLGFSRQVASQFGQYKITSNCIAPGRIESDMTNAVSAEVNRKFLENTPIKRMGTKEEVADLVKFLASENAAYITGAVIDINGGSFIG